MKRQEGEEMCIMRSCMTCTLRLRRMMWAGHIVEMGKKRTADRSLAGKPEGMRPLGRPSHRWVDNIKMILLEMGLGGADWIGLAQVRYRWISLVNAIMNIRVP
jgi:hypothetical protein